MIRRLTVLIIMLLALPAASGSATEDCSSCTIYKGYISGNMEMWKNGMLELEGQYKRDPKACTLYTLAEARYGYIGYCLGEMKRM